MKPFDFNQFQAGATALTPGGRKVTFVASHETHTSEDEATYDRLSSDYIGAFPIEIEE